MRRSGWALVLVSALALALALVLVPALAPAAAVSAAVALLSAVLSALEAATITSAMAAAMPEVGRVPFALPRHNQHLPRHQKRSQRCLGTSSCVFSCSKQS